MATALRFTLPQERLHPAMNELTAALDTRGRGDPGGRRQALPPAHRQHHLGPEGLRHGARATWTCWPRATARGSTCSTSSAPTESCPPDHQPLGRAEDRGSDQGPDPEGRPQPHDPAGAHQRRLLQRRLEEPLRPGDTATGPSPARDGSTVMVPMMRQQGRLRAATLPGLVAVALPYQDERLSMLVVLPDAGKLAEVEARLATQGLGERDRGAEGHSRSSCPCRASGSRRRIHLKAAPVRAGHADRVHRRRRLLAASTPRATCTCRRCCTRRSSPSPRRAPKRPPPPPWWSAATSAPAGPRVRVNRPFLFFVRDEPTGAILFMGRVADPSQ